MPRADNSVAIGIVDYHCTGCNDYSRLWRWEKTKSGHNSDCGFSDDCTKGTKSVLNKKKQKSLSIWYSYNIVQFNRIYPVRDAILITFRARHVACPHM